MFVALGRIVVAAFILATCAASAAAQDTLRFHSLDGETTLTGYLSRPQRETPRPAVVLMHGCSGLLGPQGRMFGLYKAWTDALVAAGYVVLVVDSAAPRGFGQTCTAGPQRLTMLRDRPKDAYAALHYLQAQAFVQRDRIGLIGWSQGGATVLLSINDKSIGRPQQLADDFRAAVAFYPGACSEVLQSKPFTQVEPESWATRTPLLVLFGEADVWTPYPPCASFIASAKARGNPVALTSYPAAVHSFDAPDLPRQELPAYRTGDGPIPVIGTDKAARADAFQRVPAFLDEHLKR